MVVEGARLAIVMDYVAGGSLRDAVKEAGPLRPLDAFTVAAEVFDALAFAHSRGVTHRDVKPDNVLLARPWSPSAAPGDVLVSDFGISRRRGREDPPDDRPHRHPAVHASRAHQPGPVRPSGRCVLNGRPALRAPRRAHSFRRAGDGLQRRVPPCFLAPAEDPRGRRGAGTYSTRCCPKIPPSARRRVRPRRRSGVSHPALPAAPDHA